MPKADKFKKTPPPPAPSIDRSAVLAFFGHAKEETSLEERARRAEERLASRGPSRERPVFRDHDDESEGSP